MKPKRPITQLLIFILILVNLIAFFLHLAGKSFIESWIDKFFQHFYSGEPDFLSGRIFQGLVLLAQCYLIYWAGLSQKTKDLIRFLRPGRMQGFFNGFLLVSILLIGIFILVFPLRESLAAKDNFWIERFFLEAIAVFLMLLSWVHYLKKKRERSKENHENANYLFDDEPLTGKHTNSSETPVFLQAKELLLNTLKIRKDDRQSFSIALNGRWGSGKTSVLNALKEEIETDQLGYVIPVNFWKARTFEGALEELQSGIREFLEQAFFQVPSGALNFFRSFSGVFHPKLSTAFDFFSREPLEEQKKITSEKIQTALAILKLKKVVFFFDDLDRMADKEAVVSCFKIIRYLADFNHCISITALDAEKISKILKSQQDPEFADFMDKIFQTRVDLPRRIFQSELMGFLIHELNPGQEGSKANLFLKKLVKEDDQKSAQNFLMEFLQGEQKINLFETYRELKLTFNAFFLKLLQIQEALKKREIIIEDNIKIKEIFYLCALQTLDKKMAESLFSQIDNKEYIFLVSYKGERPQQKEDPSADKIEENRIENQRSQKIFNGFCGYLLEDKKNAIHTDSFRFFYYPYLEDFEFSKKEIEDHFEKLLDTPQEREFLIAEILNHKGNPLSDISYHEKFLLLKSYLEKFLQNFMQTRKTDLLIELYQRLVETISRLLTEKKGKWNLRLFEYQQIIKKLFGFPSDIKLRFSTDDAKWAEKLGTEVFSKETVIRRVVDLWSQEPYASQVYDDRHWDNSFYQIKKTFFAKENSNPTPLIEAAISILQKTPWNVWVWDFAVQFLFEIISCDFDASKNIEEILCLINQNLGIVDSYLETSKNLDESEKRRKALPFFFPKRFSAKNQQGGYVRHFSLEQGKVFLESRADFIKNRIDYLYFEEIERFLNFISDRTEDEDFNLWLKKIKVQAEASLPEKIKNYLKLMF